MKPSAVKKVAIGYLIALPILLVLGLMQSRVLTDFGRVQQEADEAAKTLQEIEALLTTLKVAAGASARGLPGAAPGTESSPDATQAAARERLRQVRQLTEKNPRQTERLKRLEALVEKTFQAPGREVAQAEGARAVAESRKTTDSMGGDVTKDVREVTDEMRAEETSIIRDRSALARSLAGKASSFTALWAIVALWLIALAALLLYRKSSEQKWAGVERRMKERILESLPLGVCLTDDHGIILYTNPAEDSLLGYKQDELRGRFLANLESQPFEDRDRLAEEIVNHLQAEGSWSGEFVAVRKDHSTFNCRTRAVNMEVPGKQYRLFLQEDA
jgi:PAS domain S-box-containing protein